MTTNKPLLTCLTELFLIGQTCLNEITPRSCLLVFERPECLRGEHDTQIAESVLRGLEGEYSFNPTCTDEMAFVQVKFRRKTKREGGPDGWRADGKMHNSFHGTVVSFKGAHVYKDGDDVVVRGQFFGFKLNKGFLNWLDNYDRQLELQK